MLLACLQAIWGNFVIMVIGKSNKGVSNWKFGLVAAFVFKGKYITCQLFFLELSTAPPAHLKQSLKIDSCRLSSICCYDNIEKIQCNAIC